MTAQAKTSDGESAAIRELRQILGERLSTAAAVREQHGKDESYPRGRTRRTPSPSPQTTEEVADIVRICAPRTVRR